jgi:hypothetical protein
MLLAKSVKNGADLRKIVDLLRLPALLSSRQAEAYAYKT